MLILSKKNQLGDEKMTFEIRNKLLALLDCAYNTNPKLDKYKRFYLELSSKLCNSKAGDYNINKKRIRVLGVGATNPTRLFIVCLHELAHHIDAVNRNMSDHSEEFYNIYKTLLFTALDNQMITVDDVYEFQKGNTSDKNKVVQMLGDYRIDTSSYNPTPEKTKTTSDQVKINVFNCFEVKERVKMAGYKWNPFFKCWTKEVSQSNAKSEVAYLQQYVPENSIKLGELKWEG
jgi:hypothetical protein